MVAVPKVWPWSSDVHLRGEFDLLRREQTFTSQKEVSVQRFVQHDGDPREDSHARTLLRNRPTLRDARKTPAILS